MALLLMGCLLADGPGLRAEQLAKLAMEPSPDIKFAARMLDTADEGEPDENMVAGADAGDMGGIDSNEQGQRGVKP